ncbi:hypothetical protein H5410_037076 [Solanum commersonii]|uniref:Uncharacterized protein n=1 Tax=Solanum commersonii TaxID=4109 RepID=A0A9J5Y980_SOLCO|nr:hypothetical protein H5410_037076 [Solanum commersonii]
MEFEDYSKKDEIAWRQRSGIFRIANVRKRNNHIDHLLVGGKDIVETENIKRELIIFFQTFNLTYIALIPRKNGGKN